MSLKTLRSFFLVLFALCVAASPSRADDVYRLLQIDGHNVKWGSAEMGAGATITWHLANANSNGGSVNCRRITGVAPLLTRSRISRAAFEEAADAAMHAWQAVANIRFVRVGDDKPANLTLSAQKIPDGIAFTDVTPGSPSSSVTPLASAIVCLNPHMQWSATGNRHAKALAYVLEHEIGHALGLDHPGPSGELMSFEYSATIRTLQPGDIEGIVSLYGKATRAGAVALASPN